MKTVGNVLFFAGLVIICIGICSVETDLLLAVKMLTGGFTEMGIGCLLEEWFVEVGEYEF